MVVFGQSFPVPANDWRAPPSLPQCGEDTFRIEVAQSVGEVHCLMHPFAPPSKATSPH